MRTATRWGSVCIRALFNSPFSGSLATRCWENLLRGWTADLGTLEEVDLLRLETNLGAKPPCLVSYPVHQLGEHPCGHGGSERVWWWRRRRTSTKSPHSGGGTQLSDKVKRLEMEKRFSLLFCQIKRQRGVLAFTAWVVRTGGSLQLAPSTSYLDVLEFFAYYLSLLSFLYVIVVFFICHFISSLLGHLRTLAGIFFLFPEHVLFSSMRKGLLYIFPYLIHSNSTWSTPGAKINVLWDQVYPNRAKSSPPRCCIRLTWHIQGMCGVLSYWVTRSKWNTRKVVHGRLGIRQ